MTEPVSGKEGKHGSVSRALAGKFSESNSCQSDQSNRTNVPLLGIFADVQSANGGRKWRMLAGLLLESLVLGAVLALPLWFTESFEPVIRLDSADVLDLSGYVPVGRRDGDTGHENAVENSAPLPVRSQQPDWSATDTLLLATPISVSLADNGRAGDDWIPGEGGILWGWPDGNAPPGSPWLPGAGIGNPPPPSEPFDIGGRIEPPSILRRVEPRFPAIAIAAGITGDVIILAVIGEDGRVRSVEVASGHPLLRRAAREAVRQWVYAPTLLNGHPIAVRMEVTVQFRVTR